MFRQLINCAVVLCPLAGSVAQQPGTPTGVRIVKVDGYEVRVQFLGLEGRKPGSPVIVFEAGAMNALETWARVMPQVAIFAPVVAYDRAGLGKSAWDNETPTPQHVASRLRMLLRQIGVAPPYLLVGYSWGGTLARYFAGYHPGDVAGIVYVDPGPIVTQSLIDGLAPFDSIGAGTTGYDAFWTSFATVVERAPPAAQAEFKVMRGLMERNLRDRDLRPVPEVPVVVLIAAKPYPPFLELPYDQDAHFKADVRHRIRMLQEWALRSPRGTLVVSNHTTHAIPKEDPDLILWAILRVLSAIAKP